MEKWSKLKKRESTYTRDQYSTERLKTVFGRRLLSEIRRRDVEDYVAQRLAAGRAAATVNRELCCLKNMLRKAVDWEYIEKNPAWGVKQQAENPTGSMTSCCLNLIDVDRVWVWGFLVHWSNPKTHKNRENQGCCWMMDLVYCPTKTSVFLCLTPLWR